MTKTKSMTLKEVGEKIFGLAGNTPVVVSLDIDGVTTIYDIDYVFNDGHGKDGVVFINISGAPQRDW